MDQKRIELSKQLFKQTKAVHQDVEKLEEIIRGLRIEVKIMEE